MFIEAPRERRKKQYILKVILRIMKIITVLIIMTTIGIVIIVRVVMCPFFPLTKIMVCFYFMYFFLFACISSAGIVLLSSAAEVDLVTADSRLPNAGPVLLFNEVTTLRIRDD